MLTIILLIQKVNEEAVLKIKYQQILLINNNDLLVFCIFICSQIKTPFLAANNHWTILRYLKLLLFIIIHHNYRSVNINY